MVNTEGQRFKDRRTERQKHNDKELETEGHKDNNTMTKDRRQNDIKTKIEGHKDKNTMTEGWKEQILCLTHIIIYRVLGISYTQCLYIIMLHSASSCES